jgi:hypothetical protein
MLSAAEKPIMPARKSPFRVAVIGCKQKLEEAVSNLPRLMRFYPSRVVHIREGARFLGNASPAFIDLPMTSRSDDAKTAPSPSC